MTQFSGSDYGKVARGVPFGPSIPFAATKNNFPRNDGIRIYDAQAGGPSGDPNGPGRAPRPWPYVSGFVNFITGYPYGAASTAVRVNPTPYTSTYPFYTLQGQGLYKPPTGTLLVFS